MFLALALVFVAVAPVAAAGNAASITLVEKDGSWNPVVDGAFGKLMYKFEPAPMFVFNAHGLVPGMEYSLVNYVAYGGPNTILGTGVATLEGDLHIADVLPNLAEESVGNGAKIWLIPSGNLGTSGALNAWVPANYLFETETIVGNLFVPTVFI